jgi:hypothetical protein
MPGVARPGEWGSEMDFGIRQFEKEARIAEQPGTGDAAHPDTRTPCSSFPCLTGTDFSEPSMLLLFAEM